MWDHKYLLRIDFRLIAIIFMLMGISLLVISSVTKDPSSDNVLTPFVKNQMQWFFLGGLVFIFFAGVDYHKFLQWSWLLYALVIIMLLGLFLTKPIVSVHRWYRLPIIGIGVQPSEYTKLILVMCLGWFLEKKGNEVSTLGTAFQVSVIVGLPFLLILKQPDLGTALVLYPIALVMFYFGRIHKFVIRVGTTFGLVGVFVVVLFFSGMLPHEKMRPFFTHFMKEYQYERLNPESYHQKAALTSIAAGGLTGSGWNKSEFASRQWLPAAHTDSVFAVFGEEFGFIGLLILLFLFYIMIYLCIHVVTVAKDHYGRLLSSGIAVYLTMHILVNCAMMCGFLPISGVPLLLVSYGGSSVVTTMAALGILQSVYTRRFMF